MRRFATPLAVIAVVSLLVTSCFTKEEGDAALDNEFRAAVPAAGAMEITVPEDTSTALMLGEQAEFYQFTKGVSGSVNGHVGVLLIWLTLAALAPPSERGEDYRVWGPTEPKDLESVSWRLTIRRLEVGHYELTMEGRPKGSTDEAAFLPVISGEVFPAADQLTSRGVLNLLYDNSQTLQADPCRTGDITVEWDGTVQNERTVDVTWKDFANTCNDDEDYFNVTYHFTDLIEGGGEFEFAVVDDIHWLDNTKNGNETITMKTRWEMNGVGRSDVIVESPEIAADLTAANLTATQVTATQCWDDLFGLTYSSTTPAEFADFLIPIQGEESACGQMTTEELPALQLPDM